MKFSNAVLGLIAFTAAANGYALVFYLGEQCTDEETGTATINVTMSEPNPCGTFDGINTQSAVITPDSSEGSGSLSFYANSNCSGEAFVSAISGCVDLTNDEGSTFSYNIVETV